VIMVPGILELDMSAQPRDQNRSTAGLHAPLHAPPSQSQWCQS
jgi:hypothetical protein